jgi:hypothetical protein
MTNDRLDLSNFYAYAGRTAEAESARNRMVAIRESVLNVNPGIRRVM